MAQAQVEVEGGALPWPQSQSDVATTDAHRSTPLTGLHAEGKRGRGGQK